MELMAHIHLEYCMNRKLFVHFDLIRVAEGGVTETDKNLVDEKPAVDEEAADANKENPANEAEEEKEPEDKVNFYIYLKPFYIKPVSGSSSSMFSFCVFYYIFTFDRRTDYFYAVLCLKKSD